MKSFKVYLEEKIIVQDYFEDIKQVLSAAFLKLFGNKTLTGYMFYKILNETLNHYNIFVYSYDGDRIGGNYNTKNSKIELHIPLFYYKLVKTNQISQHKFFHLIEETLEHELIHKKQNQLSTIQLKPKYKAHDLKMQEYLSDKTEIMAYARSAIELYKAEGYSKEKINEILKNLDIKKYPNKILDGYLETFPRNGTVIKRLLSYVYQYNMAI